MLTNQSNKAKYGNHIQNDTVTFDKKEERKVLTAAHDQQGPAYVTDIVMNLDLACGGQQCGAEAKS